MSEIRRIQSQLRRSYEGPAWHGPSLREVLEGVDARTALARPIAGAHTIWELVLHVTAWNHAALRWVSGEDVGDLPDEVNFPPVADVSEGAWQNAQELMRSTVLALREAIGTMSEERLNEKVASREYTIYFLLHGVVQHNLYHAGQIQLLKRAAQPHA